MTFGRMDANLVLGYEFEKVDFQYTEKDVALYALGVGSGAGDPVDALELPFVYKHFFTDEMKVLPTFAVLFPASLVDQLLSLEALVFDPKLLLHGEQYLEICTPLPPRARVRSKSRISGLEDKGKAALLEVETVSSDADTGAALCINRSTCFLRGAGGFSAPSNQHLSKKSSPAIPPVPDRKADHVFEEPTQLSQALLYRLSGDYNPLHCDPEFAADAGFERPILHGLCSLGFAVRAVIRCCCGGEPESIRSVRARFLLHVFPGETLKTEMWIDGDEKRILFKSTVIERKRAVLMGVIQVAPTLSRL